MINEPEAETVRTVFRLYLENGNVRRVGAPALSDLRRGKNTRHLLTGLLRQSLFGRLAGYEDVNDAERLSRDSE